MNKKSRVLKFIYTLCFTALCIINWVKVTLDGRTQMTAANLTGVVVAIIILCSFELRSLIKPVYGIWLLLCAVVVPVSCKLALKSYPYQGRVVTAAINFAICGFIVIRLFYEIVEKGAFSNLRKGIFAGWVLLIIWMLISVNEDIWPLWFGIIMGAYYLIDIDEENYTNLFRAAIDGTIIGFFLLQGAALLFRPFDTIRYIGIFRNPNMNGLFYIISYTAFLCKWHVLKKNDARKVPRIVTALFSGAMFGFSIFTASKVTVFTMVIVTIPFVFFMLKGVKNKLRKLIGYGVVIFSVGLLSIPIVYFAIRYMPTIHLHPVYYEAEYSDRKVLPGESRDSDKYISFEQAMEYSFGRVMIFVKKNSGIFSKYSLTLKAYAAELTQDETEWLFTEEEYEEGIDPFDLRYRIHRSYIQRLNVLGHSNSYEYVVIYKTFVAPHAHNFFIQMAFLYGLPVGILLIGMVLAYVYGIVKLIKAGEDERACIISCFIIGVVVFGLFEENWMLGQMHFTLFFLFFRDVVRKVDVDKKAEPNTDQQL